MSSDVKRSELLKALEPHFKQIEDESLVQSRCPQEQYPCIRLDGVKASKNHLKDKLVNKAFGTALKEAIQVAYYLHRNFIHPAAGNFFLGACSFSDEVSFVLNNQGNYY